MMAGIPKLGTRVRLADDTEIVGIVVGHGVTYAHPAIAASGHDDSEPQPSVLIGLDPGIYGTIGDSNIITILPAHPDSLETL